MQDMLRVLSTHGNEAIMVLLIDDWAVFQQVLKQTPQIFGGMNIHMIEVSPYMRKKQAATLGCDSSLFDKVVKPSGGQEGDQEGDQGRSFSL